MVLENRLKRGITRRFGKIEDRQDKQDEWKAAVQWVCKIMAVGMVIAGLGTLFADEIRHTLVFCTPLSSRFNVGIGYQQGLILFICWPAAIVFSVIGWYGGKHEKTP